MNRSILVIICIVALDAIGIGLIFPILPGLLKEVTGSGEVSTVYGLLLASYAAMQFLFSPILGLLSDRIGRRPILVMSLLGAAIDYVERVGIDNISGYEHDLMTYATRGLNTVPGLRLIGTAPDKAGVLSFVLKGFATEEVGEALNREGIAVRAGHHCAQPILRRFGYESTVRPSLALYNTYADVDTLVAALQRLRGGRYNY